MTASCSAVVSAFAGRPGGPGLGLCRPRRWWLLAAVVAAAGLASSAHALAIDGAWASSVPAGCTPRGVGPRAAVPCPRSRPGDVVTCLRQAWQFMARSRLWP